MRSAKWLYQPNWWIDPVNGNDNWSGDSSTHTGGTTGPLKTHGQLHDRRGPRSFKQDTTITILGDLPTSDPLVVDEPRGSFLTTYVGTSSNVTTGTLTTFSARNTASNLPNICTTATALGSHLGSGGKRIQVTSGPAINGVCYVAKDLTGSFRLSSVMSPSTGAEQTPLNGNTFAVQTLPKVPIARINQVGRVKFDSLQIGGSQFRLNATEFIDNILVANCIIDECWLGAITTQFINCCFSSANTSEGVAYPNFWGGDHFLSGGIVFGSRLYCTRTGVLELAGGILLQGATLSPHHKGYALIDDAGIFDATVDASGAGINVFNGSAELFAAWGSGSTYGCIVDYRSDVALGQTPTVTGSAGDMLFDDTIHSWSECSTSGAGAIGGGIVSATGQAVTIMGTFGPNA